MDAPTSRPSLVDLAHPEARPRLAAPDRDQQRVVLHVPLTGSAPDDGRFEVRRSMQRRSPVRLFASGELCAYSAGFLVERLDGHTRDHVVLDLWSLTFLDSSGVSSLMQSRLRFREAGGTLVLCNPSAAVCRLVAILGLEEVLFGGEPG